MLTDLPKDVKMMKSEELVFKARLSGLSFIQLPESDRKAATDQIIARGASICGCELPGTEFFADILSQEIVEFISNYGYDEFTLSEIITAFRMNAMVGLKWPSGLEIEKIEFRGGVFSIDFMSNVLAKYNQIRHHLDRRFQNLLDGHE